MVTETSGARVLSVDLLRGIDVLLMLFVNEMAGVQGTPAFLLHKPHDTDGMTLTDVVFPAFLFIIGMAIPLALGARLKAGRPRSLVWRHVLARTAALLVMGVLMINAEQASHGLLPPDLWNVLMTVGVALVWKASVGAGDGNLRIIGFVLLIVLAFLYRTDTGSGLIQLRPSWWGILGLIGWAYLVAASIYLLVEDRPAVLLGFMALLYCLYLADEAGQVGWLAPVRQLLDVGSVLGSHAAVVVSGAVLGTMIKAQPSGSAPGLARQALGYSAGLAAAGLLLHSLHGLHPAFWINKPMATVPWCLLCSAITGAAWVIVFVVVDIRGFRRWPTVVPVAGENALVAYFLAPFLLSIFALCTSLFGGVNPYEALGRSTFVGFVRSAAFAWIVVRICGWLRSRGIYMRL
jgi:heparan-alpha-glucosaminide N-acetyltransferase